MSQFAVYENTNPSSRKLYPYLIELQSDLLSHVLATCLVAPLARDAAIKLRIEGLTPRVRLHDADYVIDIPQLAATPRKTLGAVVGSLADHRNDIIRALDRLIAGT